METNATLDHINRLELEILREDNAELQQVNASLVRVLSEKNRQIRALCSYCLILESKSVNLAQSS